jgi:hypothetical protein
VLKWTERVIAMRTTGEHTAKDAQDAHDPQSCLVAEAGRVLGMFYVDIPGRVDYRRATTELSDAVERLHPDMTGRMRACGVGGLFPSLLACHDYTQAEQLCHAVEDAILTLKRERASC